MSGKKRAMTDAMWREAFVNLADAYFHATGEICPMPEKVSVKISVKDATVAEMYRGGMSMPQIAALFGCAVNSVRSRLERTGIEIRKPQEYPKSEAQLAQAADNLSKRWAGHQKPEPKPKKKPKGRYVSHGGYVLCRRPNHPRADSRGYVPEHTLVMEASIGRFLNGDEVVHHLNRDRGDNRLENLQLMTKTAHCQMHGRENIVKMRRYLEAK